MADKKYPMTAEGKQKLEKELEDLRLNKRPEVIKRIKIARGYGDLSENSEYSSAKDDQSMLEGRIGTIEQMLQYAEVVDNENTASDIVNVGKTVTFKDEDGDEETYQIVGKAEADPLHGKISNDSPIAKGLLEHKLNENVSIDIPNGQLNVQIVKIE